MPMYFAGIGQLQRLVDRLFVRKVRKVLPRHDTSVVETFARAPPSSIEITVDLSGGTRRCISLITDLLKVCLRELKQSSVRSKNQEEEESDSFNAGVYFTTELEKRLQYKGSFLPDHQRRLLQGIDRTKSVLKRLVRPTTTEAPIKPIWNPDQVSSFFDDEANPGSSTRKEVIENIQKQQKEAARVAKKRPVLL
ncbi:unnamed protein product, partial [Mesorhabditis belari]|uniref:Uncharacterized protein n=1 Tax=Mesorhabditis belari TaxID=2138241 RepID=A0AAF3ES85_9BILA